MMTVLAPVMNILAATAIAPAGKLTRRLVPGTAAAGMWLRYDNTEFGAGQ
jgi:hypothetical protein